MIKYIPDGVKIMSKADVASERKEQIVKATVECITKFGYHNFSMQDVAKAAGVSKGIIHYYFLNKDDLMMSVLDKVAVDIEKSMVRCMESAKDAASKLDVFVDVTFEIVRNTKEYYQVNMDFWTQINQKEEIRKVIANHYSKFRDTCAKILKEGIDTKKFKAINPNEYASVIIGLLDGLSLQWLFDENVFDYERVKKLARDCIFDHLRI